ncbi:hypothetical protein NE237_009789 [Protea cynaroides]|uniref:Uncharacterized protein n=1 Tax=Protea cynaroides TaxID=273540 RepID=A0A9Q0KYK5_9MAGN|nr:hypothetical protein NE237_009789 [Protea cynaroides]
MVVSVSGGAGDTMTMISSLPINNLAGVFPVGNRNFQYRQPISHMGDHSGVVSNPHLLSSLTSMVVLGGPEMVNDSGPDGSRYTFLERPRVDLGRFLSFPYPNIENPILGNNIGGYNSNEGNNIIKERKKSITKRHCVQAREKGKGLASDVRQVSQADAFALNVETGASPKGQPKNTRSFVVALSGMPDLNSFLNL